MRLLLLLLLFAPPAHAATPVVEGERADLPLTRRAYNVFVRTCPDIPQAVRQSSSVSVEANIGYPQYRQMYGWTAIALVRMQLADGRGLMPPLLVGASSMRDAWFIIAGPPRPGVLPVTGAARTICGRLAALQEGEEELIPVPALGFLKQWPSSAAFDRANSGRKLDSTACPLPGGPTRYPGCD